MPANHLRALPLAVSLAYSASPFQGFSLRLSDFQLQMPLPFPFTVVLVFELEVRYSSACVYTKGRVSVLLGAKVGCGLHLRCEGTRVVCK